MTYTFVKLAVSLPFYNLVHAKLKEAGYDHHLHADGVIDMHGLALVVAEIPAVAEEVFDRIQKARIKDICASFRNEGHVGWLEAMEQVEATRISLLARAEKAEAKVASLEAELARRQKTDTGA
jgi:ABC-type hemin transport system substrate-binding protein